MDKKYLIFWIAFAMGLLLPVGSALDELPTAKQGQLYTITQTCASCSYVNISVKNINGFVLNNVEMINNGSGVWIYEYTPITLGRYDVIGKGDLSGTDTSFATYFDVTGTGYELDQPRAVIYLGLLTLLIFLFVLSIFGIGWLPSGDNRDEEGNWISVNKLKYLRIVFFGIAWFLLISIFYTSSNIAFAYLGTTMFASLLFKFFQIMMVMSYPLVLFIFLLIFYNIFQDKKFKRMYERGFE